MTLTKKQINARIEKIKKDIGELHFDLVASDMTAWLSDIPVIEIATSPDTMEMKLAIKLGLNDI